MPVIKSAKKKMRQDKKRQQRNTVLKNALIKAIKKSRKKPTLENVKEAISLADKASKHNIIHRNKAGRIKSSLSKLVKKPAKTQIKKIKK